MRSQLLIFSFTMTFAMFFLWAIICWRMIRPLPCRRSIKWLLAIFLFISLVIYYITRMFVGEGMPVEVNVVLRWTGYLSLGFISLVIPFLFVKEMTLLGKRVVERDTSTDPQRRVFLQNAGNAAVLAVVAPTMAFSVGEAFQKPVVKRTTIPVAGLPADLDGVTIAQISDLHVGSILDAKWLRPMLEQVSELQPDMLALTGDAIDGSVSRVGKELESLAAFQAPLGKFFVTGNHEFYSGVDDWVAKMRELGFTVLNNEHALVEKGHGKLLIAGVWDYKGEQFGSRYTSDPVAAKQGAPEHHVSMLLAHQPKSVYAASKAGYDIQLSGHTHGGQYFPWTYAIHFFQQYVKGMYQVDATTLYVNTGTGFWGPPMRLTVPPEITLHTLVSA